jgi:hypothetical protein
VGFHGVNPTVSSFDFEIVRPLYGGNQTQERNGVTDLPWHTIQDYS